jgi:hypothetical protein
MPELPNSGLGETDQPLIPGQKWRIRDLNRPKPTVVTPALYPGQPPSDAVVLFDGKDLSQWTVGGGGRGRGTAPPAAAPVGSAAVPQPAAAPAWRVENGYMEMVPGTGSLASKERFKDFQLHIEFAAPPVPLGKSQYRGNSGITIGGREIQILDNFKNDTYADGYVGAVYNQWPPLANAARPPGEWQTLDVAYMAPRYEGDRLVRNAFVTIFLNGVMIHNNREIFPSAGRGGGRGAAAPLGGAASANQMPTAAQGRGAAAAIPPGADQPIGLMGHPSAIPGNAVRYRNVWVRRVDVELPTQPPQTPDPVSQPPPGPGQRGRGRGGQPIVLGPDDKPIAPPAQRILR